jgi:hypothetical protein
MTNKTSVHTRRAVLSGAIAGMGLAVLAAADSANAASALGSVSQPMLAGRGSASGAPFLPAGFRGTFKSRYVDANGVRLHAVIGGKGPPLLLVHGWPQTWYQWRLIMPRLAQDFTVIAVDQRGIGLSDKPQGGYDSGSQASDMVALMDALGHRRFASIPECRSLTRSHPTILSGSSAW